ncbi:hypothetical protein LTS18_009754, partial [Coniosporium uncinatum]
MDRDRLKNQKYGPGKKYPRLMCEAELPDLYLSEEGPAVEEPEAFVGRGARERTRVKYDDGLTEEQWLEAVDNDDAQGSLEDAMARAEMRKRRKVERKEKKVQGEMESPVPSRSASESPAPKKRGRKPKAVLEKRKADVAMLDVDTNPAPRKRGRQPKVQETLTPEERAVHQKILDAVFDSVADMTEDGGERDITFPFLELPPKSDYPDYYQLIKRPICLTDIQKKINGKVYQSLKEYWNDMKTLCSNCRQYNEDGSVLFQDANKIEEHCLKKLRDETEPYPELQDFDDGSMADGNSTAPISSVGTPMGAGSS